MNRTTRYPDLCGWWDAYTRGFQMLVCDPSTAKVLKMYRNRNKSEIERRNIGKLVVSVGKYFETVMTCEERDRRNANLLCCPVPKFSNKKGGCDEVL